MMKDTRVAVSLPCSDLDKAKAWYKDKLGLEPASEFPAGAMYETGKGTGFLLYPSQFAGSNQATVATWDVSGHIDESIAELKSKGVVFEEYNLEELKTVNGIATFPDGNKAAWFKDPDGNIHALATM